MAQLLSSDVINPGTISQECCWIPHHYKFLRRDCSLYRIIHCIQIENKEDPMAVLYKKSDS